MKTESNISDNHRMNYINCLCRLSQFHGKTKTLREMSREDVILFLKVSANQKTQIHYIAHHSDLYQILMPAALLVQYNTIELLPLYRSFPKSKGWGEYCQSGYIKAQLVFTISHVHVSIFLSSQYAPILVCFNETSMRYIAHQVSNLVGFYKCISLYIIIYSIVSLLYSSQFQTAKNIFWTMRIYF